MQQQGQSQGQSQGYPDNMHSPQDNMFAPPGYPGQSLQSFTPVCYATLHPTPLLHCVMPHFTPFGHLFLLLVLSKCYCHFINFRTLLPFIFYPFYKLLSYEIRFVYSIPSLTSQPSLQSLVSSRIQILASTMTLSKSTSLLILIILNFRLVWSNSFVWCDAIWRYFIWSPGIFFLIKIFYHFYFLFFIFRWHAPWTNSSTHLRMRIYEICISVECALLFLANVRRSLISWFFLVPSLTPPLCSALLRTNIYFFSDLPPLSSLPLPHLLSFSFWLSSILFSLSPSSPL